MENCSCCIAYVIVHRLNCVKLQIDPLSFFSERSILMPRTTVLRSTCNLIRQLVRHSLDTDASQNAVIPFSFLCRRNAGQIPTVELQRVNAVSHPSLIYLRMEILRKLDELFHCCIRFCKMDFLLMLFYIIRIEL